MDFSLVALRRLLIAVASLVVENGLQGMWAPIVAVRGLSSCGSWTREHRLNSCGLWAWLLCGMWNLPRPRIESASPALAGRFFTTESPGKPRRWIFIHCTTREVPSVLNNLVALFKEEKGIGDINHGLPYWFMGKESTCQYRRRGFDFWVGKIPLEKEMATPSSILAGKPHRPKSLPQSMGSQRVRHDLVTKQQQGH